MTIPKATKDFVDSLIDYYISEVTSYRQIAESFIPIVDSVSDTAFGIITGCIYSGFQQTYTDKGKKPELDEVKEFYKILKEKAPLIKKAILEVSISNLEKMSNTQTKGNE